VNDGGDGDGDGDDAMVVVMVVVVVFLAAAGLVVEPWAWHGVVVHLLKLKFQSATL